MRSAVAEPLEGLEDTVRVSWADGRAGVRHDHLPVARRGAGLDPDVTAGDAVTITLADGATTPGKVASIGADATEPASNGSAPSAPPPTVAATITPTDPAALGTVDQAPVSVAVSIADVHQPLAVPAAALVTTSAGQPAIDVLNPAGAPHTLPVTLGVFDDASDLVQITAPGITAGETIALPAQLTPPT